MKLHKALLPAAAMVTLALSVWSCKDDDMFTVDGKQAFIYGDTKENSLSVVGQSGIKWSSRMSNDTIYIKLSPTFDATVELKDVYPKFFISKGSTVSPDPSLPQDFSDLDNPITYTVTSEDGKTSRSYVVTYGPTDFLPYGEGFTLGAKQMDVLFPDLGYPGTPFTAAGVTDSRRYGDLNGYVAYCGHDHIVLLARQYSDPRFDSSTPAPDFDLGIKVFKADDLTPDGVLNTGGINRQNIRAITSDWVGNMVAVVYTGGASSDIYYWTKPTDAPVLLTSASVCLAPAVDGSNYVQVAGDVTAKANISCPGQRGLNGDHYMIHVEGGAASEPEKFSTGYRSDDCNGFQMTSPMSAELHPDYAISDGEGVANTNNSLRVYTNNWAGGTTGVLTNAYQSVGAGGFHDWWSGNGGTLARTGGRHPYISAMPINGKTYIMMMAGTAWWYCNVIIEAGDLHTRVTGAEVDYVIEGIGKAWSFGATGDWYYDESTHTGYWVGYTDRYGMFTMKFTCYE